MSLPNQNAKIYLLAGPTGSGKSELIQHFQKNNIQALDLETMCCHDGSVFSSMRFSRQPTSYQFHKQLMKTWSRFDLTKPIFVESELKRIGNINLPDWLVTIMNKADIILLDVDKNLRRARLSQIIEKADSGEFTACLKRLSYKLGPEKLAEAMALFNLASWEETAEILMAYYDATPGYSFSTQRVKFRIVINKWDAEDITNQIFEKLEKIVQGVPQS